MIEARFVKVDEVVQVRKVFLGVRSMHNENRREIGFGRTELVIIVNPPPILVMNMPKECRESTDP